MAHATDYHSIADISRLKKSSSHAKPPENAYILVLNFLRSNDNWSIDSLVRYCMSQYADFGVTPEIIGDAIKTYISE